MKFTSAIIFLSLSACISPTYGKKRKDKADEIPPPVCGSTVQCGGEAYTGEVKLTEDLNCPSGDYASGDCAITLNGKQAVLDCNKYMINNNLGASDNGICILNGATAINCHVQKFGIGIYVQNGGEVKDCEVMFNEGNGVLIKNEASSTTKMKISNTYIHDNYRSGIYFFGSGESPESSETSIEVNNVQSSHNGGHGMTFRGSNVTLEMQIKDSETSSNGLDGIFISRVSVDVYAAVDQDGIIRRYNKFFGLYIASITGDMKVKGAVNLYKNRDDGFVLFRAGVDVVVERRGALNSCGNLDIDINGVGTFSGNGYTCNSTSPSNIITCDPCPNCPQ